MKTPERLKLCCHGLTNLFEERGERGLSLLIKRDGEQVFCVVQSNAMSAKDHRLFIEQKLRLPVDMTLQLQQAISYCPFCGCGLREWLIKNSGEAEKALELSKEFLLPGL